MENPLSRIRAVADYQFGQGVGAKLFPMGVTISFSVRTGRMRYVFMEGKRIVTMRPKEGLFSLSIEGAKRIVQAAPMAKCLVVVQENVSKFVAEGGDVFARHVIWADNEIRAEDEVIVVDKASRVLAVGRASLSSEEMKAFRRGVAVKVRRGYMDEG